MLSAVFSINKLCSSWWPSLLSRSCYKSYFGLLLKSWLRAPFVHDTRSSADMYQFFLYCFVIFWHNRHIKNQAKRVLQIKWSLLIVSSRLYRAEWCTLILEGSSKLPRDWRPFWHFPIPLGPSLCPTQFHLPLFLHKKNHFVSIIFSSRDILT